MDEILRVDVDAPPKQRHTAHRIWERLVDEQDALFRVFTEREERSSIAIASNSAFSERG